MPSFSNTVSVVMATYNGERYLREQLDSIAAQTLQPTQIIIQDDSSDDQTVAIVQEYASYLPIQLETNSHNIGYVRNFELALSKAEGKYIAICDQDDIWEPNKLELLLKTIGTKTLIYSDSLLIDADGNSLNQTLSDKLKNNFISTDSPLSFIYDNCISAHALLFHRSLLPQLFPFPKHLYFDAWIAANATSINGISYLNQRLVRYRQHASNTLSRRQKVSLPISEKITHKTAKKAHEHAKRAEIIHDLLTIQTLTLKDRELLSHLQKGHLDFPNRWFNLSFFRLLFRHQGRIFAITKRNSFTLSLKKAIGLKLYQLFPFL